ncbi:MAG: alpha/beta hydrolase [Richelia sp.]|nr:alpha/beta hydrolase [Richelia sp.]
MVIKVISRNNLFYQRSICSFLIIIVSTLFTTIPLVAAQKIYAAFGPVDFSVAVKDVENFVNTGEVTPELKFLINKLSPEQREELPKALQKSYDINSVMLSQAFYDPMGEKLLALHKCGMN